MTARSTGGTLNVDHAFGAVNPRDAVSNGYTIAKCLEKLGSEEFKREYESGVKP